MKALLVKALSLLLASLIGWTPGIVFGATPLLTQYRHTTWGEQQGVDDLRTVAKGQDGYLWLGTGDGLLRFDGTRFTRVGELAGFPLPNSSIYSLLGASDGSLWVGSQGHVTRFQKDHVEDHLIVGRPWAIDQDANGGIWLAQSRTAGRQGGLCRVKANELHCFGPADGNLPRATALEITADGTVWSGGDEGLCRWTLVRAPECHLHDFLGPTYGIAGIGAVLETRRGEQWVGIRKAGHPYGIGHLVDGHWAPYITSEFNGAALDVTSLLEDSDECLWIGTTDQGIYRIDHGRVDHFDKTDGLSGDAVGRMLQDRDGTVWVVTDNGLDAFHKMPVIGFSAREGLPATSGAAVVAARDGRVWIGGRPFSALLNDKPAQISFAKLFERKQTTSMLEDPRGRLWVGVEDQLVVIDGDSVRYIRDRNGKSPGAIMNLANGSRGDVWAVTASPRKLLHIDGSEFEELGVDPDLRSVSMSPQGHLLLSFGRGTIGEYSGKKSGEIATNSGTLGSTALSANATSIWPDEALLKLRPNRSLHAITSEADGTIIGSTSEGLLMMRGQTRLILGVANGLPCNAVSSAVRDSDRVMWLLMPCGIVSIAAAEIERWYAQPTSKIEYRRYDVFDGFRSGVSGFSPTISVAPDGRIWFANEVVAQVIDPRSARQGLAAPPVKIEEITADRVTNENPVRLQFAPRTRDIEIHYTALSFVLPAKVKFKYRLEGRDRDWTDAGARRVAYYTDLDPGSYRFQVIACNSDGVWNETGAALAFEVQAAFYRTRWFAFVCVVVSLALLYCAHVARLRWLAARLLDRAATRLAEREHIARDLHDTLLQSTEGLILVVQAASDQMAKGDPARKAIDRALTRGSALIAEGRDRVHALRRTGAEEIDLVEELRALGKALSSTHDAAFTLEMNGNLDRIAPSVRDEFFLILREGLSNAFQHAMARSVDLLITEESNGLRASIRDDGRGLDIQAIESGQLAGHWGIKGMQERARRVDAMFEIRSRLGGGTEIELFVPASLHAARPRRWIDRVFQRWNARPSDYPIE